MENQSYQFQQDRILEYKKKILDTSNELLPILEQYSTNVKVTDIESLLKATGQISQSESLKNEIRKHTQKILSFLSSIGTLGVSDPEKFDRALASYSHIFESSLFQNPGIGSAAIRLILTRINSTRITVEKKHPYTIKIDYNFYTGTLSGTYHKD